MLPAPAPDAAPGLLPVGYTEALEQLKSRIRSAQLQAAVSVNELIRLSWDIGKQVVARQQAESWGRSVVSRLAQDLLKEFPGVAGFSLSNLWHMRSIHLAYTEEVVLISGPCSTRLRRSGTGKFGGGGLDNSVAVVKLVDQNGPPRG